MKKIKPYIPILFVVLCFFFIYAYRLVYAFDFHPDFARDIYDMLTMIQGKLRLTGPKHSFGGIYTGPWYYYFFTPIFSITNLSIPALLYTTVALFLSAVVLCATLLTRKHTIFARTFSLLALGLVPIYVLSSRGPWNGSVYLPLLLMFLTLLYQYDGKGKARTLFFIGFLGGIIATIHMLNLVMIGFAIIYLLFFMKQRKYILFFFLGIMLAYAPLILFEIKHDFVMLKNTFFDKSYQGFLENKNTISPDIVSLIGHLSTQVGIHLGFYLLLCIGFWKMYTKRNKFFILSSGVLIVLFTLLLRFSTQLYYFYPLSLFLAFTIVISILATKRVWLFFLLLISEIYFFPQHMYEYATRRPETYETVVQQVIGQEIVKHGDLFNVIQVSKTYGTAIPIGHEYRFFFRKHNLTPKSELEYNQSDILLVFSNLKDFDINTLDNWEINEFGRQHVTQHQEYHLGETTVYKIAKSEKEYK